jgi:hypothetical protein
VRSCAQLCADAQRNADVTRIIRVADQFIRLIEGVASIVSRGDEWRDRKWA